MSSSTSRIEPIAYQWHLSPQTLPARLGLVNCTTSNTGGTCDHRVAQEMYSPSAVLRVGLSTGWLCSDLFKQKCGVLICLIGLAASLAIAPTTLAAQVHDRANATVQSSAESWSGAPYQNSAEQSSPGNVSSKTKRRLAKLASRFSDAEVLETYSSVIKPLFKTKCYSCHGALAQQGGLRVDTVELMRQGGDSGSALAEESEQALLLQRVIGHEQGERMPLEGVPLDNAQLSLLRTWLDAGAPAPENEAPEQDPNQHWAFIPPRETSPRLRLQTDFGASATLEHNSIDRWINDALAQRNLQPLGEEERDTLLRRLTLDLTGLPPEVSELEEFRNDRRPDAYERQVERLLASPTFGQRWARHWMDIWRYADWFGRRSVPDVWNSAPQIWRWRDWIVDSVNSDLGYDHRIQMMLAADEIAADQPNQSVATGYLIRNWYALNPNDWMRANVEHSARAFLGLSLQCAHCHDHKYDPITQRDYFAFRAFFEPLGIRQDQLSGEEDPGAFQEYEYSTLRRVERRGRVSTFDRNPEAITWMYSGGDERNRLSDLGPVTPSPPQFLTDASFSIEPLKLPTIAWYPGLDTILIESQRVELQTQLAELSSAEAVTSPPSPPESLLAASDQLFRATQLLLEQPDTPAVSKAIAGERSLLIDASHGRRILQRHLPKPDTAFARPQLSVEIRLLSPAHFNMQLAKSSRDGLTAGYVGFEQGRVLSYRPGTFEEFQVGEYSLASPATLRIEWTFEFERDLALLSVIDIETGARITNDTPIAINGWQWDGDPNRPLTFDARSGSIAMIDQLRLLDLAEPNRPEMLLNDFEPTAPVGSIADQELGSEIIGVEGWSLSHLSTGQAWSRITSVRFDDSLLKLAQQVESLLAMHLQSVPDASYSRIRGRRLTAELESLDTRVAAEFARVSLLQESSAAQRAEAHSLAAIAAEAYQRWQTLKASTRLPEVRAQLQAARALPIDAPDRASKIEAAEQRYSAVIRDSALAAENKIDPAALAEPAIDASSGSQSEGEQTASSLPNAWDPSQPPTYPMLSRTYPETSTGRRSALARWITDRRNPLAARVAVNHLWARHFHRPLVETVDDFGRNGAAPAHPELLDNLAVELMESGWSLKQIHRRMVTSAAYRRSSGRMDSERTRQQVAALHQLGEDNLWYWKRSSGRMEAEVVRDAILAQAGRLDLRFGGQELENAEAFASGRRSLYFSCQPEIDGRSEFASLFDAPDPTQCYRRTRSLMPQQALALTNSQLVHENSSLVASRLQQELTARRVPASDEDRAFIVLAFETVLSRPPRDEELTECLEFLNSASAEQTQERTTVRASLIRVLWNHHQFVTIR